MLSYQEKITPKKSKHVSSQRDLPLLWKYRTGSAFPHRAGEQITEFSRMNLKMFRMVNFSLRQRKRKVKLFCDGSLLIIASHYLYFNCDKIPESSILHVHSRTKVMMHSGTISKVKKNCE